MEEPGSTLTLFEGDCLDIFSQIKDGSIDMVLCDPPYGTTQCKWDSAIDLDKMWTHLKRIVKPNGAIVIFTAQPFTSKLISSNYKMFKQEIIWKKNIAGNFMHANKRHLSAHENICVFYRKQPIYNKQFRKGESYIRKRAVNDDLGEVYGNPSMIRTEGQGDKDKRNPISVIKYDRPSNTTRCHPSEKPVDLLCYFINTFSNENDTVLDFTMGSGSTGVACKNTKRNFIGIEKNSEFFKLASERLNMVEDDWKKQLKEKYKSKIKKRKIEKEIK